MIKLKRNFILWFTLAFISYQQGIAQNDRPQVNRYERVMGLRCSNSLEMYTCPLTCSDLTVYQHTRIKLENVPEKHKISLRICWERSNNNFLEIIDDTDIRQACRVLFRVKSSFSICKVSFHISIFHDACFMVSFFFLYPKYGIQQFVRRSDTPKSLP